jgi:hypothetical protein
MAPSKKARCTLVRSRSGGRAFSCRQARQIESHPRAGGEADYHDYSHEYGRIHAPRVGYATNSIFFVRDAW